MADNQSIRIGGDEYRLPSSQENCCRCGMKPVIVVTPISGYTSDGVPYCRMCYRVRVVLPRLNEVLSLFP